MESLAPLSSLLEDLSSRLAAIEAHVGLPSGASTGSSAGAGSGAAAPAPKKPAVVLSPSVVAFDELGQTALAPFLAAATAVGDKAAELVRPRCLLPHSHACVPYLCNFTVHTSLFERDPRPLDNFALRFGAPRNFRWGHRRCFGHVPGCASAGGLRSQP
jgi:hypothetical protein